MPHQIMTDGCGFLNYAALKAIQINMAWETFPTCVQARIAGAKGIFLLHPDHRDPSEEPQIWMRPSQVKISLDLDPIRWSPVHRVLDVLCASFVQQPSSITFEIIINLAENGVPHELLASLLRNSIEQAAQSLEPPQESHPYRSHILWDSVFTTQRVLPSRLRQIIPPEVQRAQGFFEYDNDKDTEPEATSAPKWEAEPDPTSGEPASKQEQVLGLLQAGFAPIDPFVMDKLVYLQQKVLDAAAQKYRITMPKCLRAFIAPDPLGVLEEGQVFFASSHPMQINELGPNPQRIVGPVIVSRNPCVQISDTRKVQAVQSRELLHREYYDVIIFSTKGTESLASLLSGGDYDGDTAIMIWGERITESFRNSSLEFARPEPGFKEANFDESQQRLSELKAPDRLEQWDVTRLAEALLQNITPGLEGIYNILYRKALYVHGLRHQDTVRLGHMYAQCLDAVKAGLTVKSEVLEQDRAKWRGELPSYFNTKPKSGGHNYQTLTRRLSNRFILETLARETKNVVGEHKTKLGQLKDQRRQAYNLDTDLMQPIEEPKRRARAHPLFQSQLQSELKTIQDHVQKYRMHLSETRNNQGKFSVRERLGKKSKGDVTNSEYQESIRMVSEAYALDMPTGLAMFDNSAVRRIAASFAYQIDYRSRGKYPFCFVVAWSELCALKAQAKGPFVALTSGFVESMAIHKKMVRVFQGMEGGEKEEHGRV